MKDPMKIAGLALAAVGAVVSIAQAIVGEKKQQQVIAEEVAKAVAKIEK